MIQISVVIPVLNEGNNLFSNIETIIKYLKGVKKCYEIILIDDGSTDNTWNVIEELSTKYEAVIGYKFARNFGKEAAMFAGLEKSQGEAVIIMDSDLEHPPSLIEEMVDKWSNHKYLVIEAIKKTRSDKGKIYLLIANSYNKLFKKVTGLDLTNSSDYKLIDRQVVNNLLKMGEVNTFFRGMVTWTGYRKIAVHFDVPKRAGDKSKFSFMALARLATTSIISFSSAPLQLVTSIGILFLIISLIGTIHTLVKYSLGQALEGFTTIILLIFFTGSLMMIGLGIIGVYISKIYEEVKARPKYIIEDKTLI